jgi:hypothetical protein
LAASISPPTMEWILENSSWRLSVAVTASAILKAAA